MEMADRCRVGPGETVVQQDRHVHQSVSLPTAVEWSWKTERRQAAVARAYLYYKKRRSKWQLVVVHMWALMSQKIGWM
jgi:hypothetical protein